MKGGGHLRPDPGLGLMLAWILAGPAFPPSSALAARLWFWEQGAVGMSASVPLIHSRTGTGAALVTGKWQKESFWGLLEMFSFLSGCWLYECIQVEKIHQVLPCVFLISINKSLKTDLGIIWE